MSLKGGGGVHTARKQPIWHRGRCQRDMYSAGSVAADNGGAGWRRLDGRSGNFYGGQPRLRLIQSDLRIHRIIAGWGCGGMWCFSRSSPESQFKVGNVCFELIKLRGVAARTVGRTQLAMTGQSWNGGTRRWRCTCSRS